MRTFGILLAALALSMAEASAQDRRPLVGVVRGADGAPVANATVRCAYVPPGFEQEDAFDVVTVRADGSGRYRADVLPCAIYRVWAIGLTDGDGSAFVSRMVDAAAGQPTDLLADQPQSGLQLKLQGLEAWRALAPFRVRCLPNGVRLADHVFAIGGDGTVVIPPRPHGYARLQLLDKDGEVLDAPDLDVSGEWTWAIEPPTRQQFLTLDAKDRPLAGVAVWQGTVTRRFTGHSVLSALSPHTDWRQLGTTDASGRLASDVVASEGQPGPVVGTRFVALHPEHAIECAGFFGDGKRFENGQVVADRPGDPLRFVLRRHGPGGLTARGPDDVPGLHLRLAAELPIHLDTAGQSCNSMPFAWTSKVDAEHAYEFTCLPRAVLGAQLAIAPSTRWRAAFPAELHTQLPPQPIALHAIREVNWPAAPLRAPRLDLAQTSLVQLRVLDEQGGPPRGAEVFVCSSANHYHIDEATFRTALDSTGRVAFRAQRGRWFVFVHDGSHACWSRLDARDDCELSLNFQALPRMHGVLTDASGKPVAHAQLHSHSMYRLAKGDVEAEQEALATIAMEFAERWTYGVTTNANGEFIACALAEPLIQLRLQFATDAGDCEPFLFAPSRDAIPVTLR